MSDRFAYALEALQQIVRDAGAHAMNHGGTSWEAEASEGGGQSVTVRRGEVETIEHHRDKGLGVTVYIGQRRGHASTSDFSPQAVRDTVDKALTIARYTAPDECAGLAEADLMARDIPELDLYHPWELSVEQAMVLARRCEAAALAADPRISNSEGATVSSHDSHFVYGNSWGFLAGYPGSRHSVSCSVVAGEGDGMQRDDWYTTARSPVDLEDVEQVGRIAGQRAAARLNARKIATVEAPVVFEAPAAASLIGHFVAAVSGGNLYRKSSFLTDSLGRRVFSAPVTIHEQPHLRKGLSSAPFDNEGVATTARDVVAQGMLQGYFLSSYSARKLGLASTGNAGGPHNLLVSSAGHGPEAMATEGPLASAARSLAALLKELDQGLLITELLGQGVNLVTGDYSRGAAGFWVEGGEIAYPVHEITVAGNLRQMFLGIRGIADDARPQGSVRCGSLLLERMTVAGE